MKRFTTSLSLIFALSVTLNAQFFNPEASEQMKRTLRKNNHIEKTMNGQIVKRLFKGTSKALYGFVFKSDEENFYHVSLREWEGREIMPYLTTNEPLELTVTGDPKLLEEVIHLTPEYLTLENKLDMRLKGLAHFESVKSSGGQFIRNKSAGRFDMTREPDRFHENIAIVSKKKVPGNAWAYALENEDTIIVSYDDDDLLKGKKKLTYFTSASPLSRGNYLKAPHTYNFLGKAPHAPGTGFSHWMMAGRSASLLEKETIAVMGSHLDKRGLLNGFKLAKGTLYFNAKNGEHILNATRGKDSFEAYVKKTDENTMILYAIKNGEETVFYDNNDLPFTTRNHYNSEQVSFTGDVTEVHPLKEAQSVKLKSFIVNDSIYVSVNQVVALNIQKMIKEGKKVSITGYMRKEVPGEVNEKGYAIMALSKIVVNGKTFNQIISDITQVL